MPLSDRFVLKVLPKVPIARIFQMIEYVYDLKSLRFLDGITTAGGVEDLYEKLVARLVDGVLRRVHLGLYRGYVETEDVLPWVRGTLLLGPTMRAFGRTQPRWVQLHCRFEEHTADLCDNQILAWTLFLLSHHEFHDGELACRVREAYRALAPEVTVRPVSPSECVRRSYHHLNEDYRPLHALCRFFLEHCGPLLEESDREFLPFLVHMPTLFERFLAAWLARKRLPALHVKAQHQIPLGDGRRFRIDIVLKDLQSRRIVAVPDTKYKLTQGKSLADVQQAVAYAAGTGCRTAILVYPFKCAPVCLNVGAVRVYSVGFDLDAPIDVAGNAFLQDLTRILGCR
jgi:5-methylcytosine-specific restriction enzyme subunit McrC